MGMGGGTGYGSCGGTGFGGRGSEKKRSGVYVEGAGAGKCKANPDGNYFLVPKKHLVPIAGREDGRGEDGLVKKTGEDKG